MPKITAELTDGTAWDLTVPAKSWMCLADRVAFERRFGENVPTMASRMKSAKDDDSYEGLREEQIAFFAWRILHRHADGDVPDFDPWIEDVVDLTVDHGVEPDPSDSGA